jgi:chorismate--pyruvate lyase
MLTRAPRWQPRRQLWGGRVPPPLRSWLLEDGSLTRRLRAICGSTFGLELLSSTWGRPLPDECRLLALPCGGRALVRQVRLLCSGRPVVYARSVIPGPSLVGTNRRLARLGRRPLAEVLFAPGAAGRGPLEIAELAPGHPLYTMAGGAGEGGSLWARRSLFFPARKALLVTEVFLPAVAGLEA